MQYRTLGRTGLQVSEVSLGTEYLIGKPHAHIVAVIREAIAQGINYFDLFCAEPDFRDAMGEAFTGHREKVTLAAHLGAAVKDGQYNKTRNVKVCQTFFDDFLTRYHTDYADVLLLHNCDSQKDFDQLFRENGPLGLALRLKAEGKARFLGFSGHTVETALQAIESGHIDVLMFPINLTGNAIPGKKDLFRACVTHGVGLVAMKPFGGGKLLQGPRTVRVARYQTGGDALKISKTEPITPVQCLAYTLSQVGVSAAVPGCADLEQLHAALAYEQATDAEKDFSDILADFEQVVSGECVYCNHCLPCPSAIDIGQTLRLFDIAQQGMTPALRAAYDAMPTHAADCIACGACEKRCPFGVPTVARIQEAAAFF
ncbi:MAG TPA: aldo/keto reductase [Anaerolineae bacterium]|nr:aldo/keto reductase [Anaerolineae bacterium]